MSGYRKKGPATRKTHIPHQENENGRTFRYMRHLTRYLHFFHSAYHLFENESVATMGGVSEKGRFQWWRLENSWSYRSGIGCSLRCSFGTAGMLMHHVLLEWHACPASHKAPLDGQTISWMSAESLKPQSADKYREHRNNIHLSGPPVSKYIKKALPSLQLRQKAGDACSAFINQTQTI